MKWLSSYSNIAMILQILFTKIAKTPAKAAATLAICFRDLQLQKHTSLGQKEKTLFGRRESVKAKT